jgi:hypothetical protein
MKSQNVIDYIQILISLVFFELPSDFCLVAPIAQEAVEAYTAQLQKSLI